jgi:two-component system, OmpR family, response regulator
MKELAILRECTALYVEDDLFLRETTAELLGRLFREVIVAGDGAEALAIIEARPIHTVIADIKMPNMDGLEMARAIRQRFRHMPIFITSSYAETEDLLAAVRLNLVDYLTKPLSWSRLKEALGACAQRLIEAGLWRTRLSATTAYCAASGTIHRADEEIFLTAKEKVLLDLLLAHRGQLVNKERIFAVVYAQEEDATEGGLKNLVLKLRRKVGEAQIVNVYGSGFMLRADDAA